MSLLLEGGWCLMSQKLLAHSKDLQKLVSDGYELEIRGSFALVHHVPYVNYKKEIKYGTLVSNLAVINEKTIRPNTHVIHFIGDHPCNKDGEKMTCIAYQSITTKLGEDIIVQHSFSNKPINGYSDYYEEFVQYIKIISSPAVSIDTKATAQTYRMPIEESESVFNYLDTNSTRASIGAITEKLKYQNIGIIGLGGSGSYVLDLVAKCPVNSIQIFDGDIFYQHNAFRAPGAANVEDLNQQYSKVEYMKRIYSNMHKNVQTHECFITEENVCKLGNLDFVFMCVDNGNVKKIIMDYLLEKQIPFVDTGIGVISVEDYLLGQVRSTIVSTERKDGISSIDMNVGEKDDAYSSNIQIAELNALSACMAVIQWKKHFGFYQDVREYTTDVYCINDGGLVHEKD